MTRFQKKQQDALAAFQKEMNQFGLYVNTRVFGGMYSDDEKYFCLEAGTNAQPVKGNKALIEKIKAAGYIVVKSRQTDETGRNVYVFWVMKIYRILREENDAQEYTEKPERPVPFRPEIGKTYDNRGGGRFRCLWSSQPGAAFTGATFINVKSGWKFQAAGIRRYSDGTIEWDCSNGGHFDTEEINPCNCLNCGRQGCVHRGTFRRLPIDEGGLGLCPNLKED